jgi:hypothetical protein
MISIERMNLNVDDWHGRLSRLFAPLSVIVTGLDRVRPTASGARQAEWTFGTTSTVGDFRRLPASPMVVA